MIVTSEWLFLVFFDIFAIDSNMFFDFFGCFFVRQQDDIHIMLEWKQVSIHLRVYFQVDD
jgi:hypothetical protein